MVRGVLRDGKSQGALRRPPIAQERCQTKTWILSHIHSSNRARERKGRRDGEEVVRGCGIEAFRAEALPENAAGSAVGATAGDLCKGRDSSGVSLPKKKSLETSLQVKVRSWCLEVQFKLHRELRKLLCNELRNAVASGSVLKASTDLSATEDVHSH